MADAGGPGGARKCPGLALADLGDTEGFKKDGEEGQLYGLQLSNGVYKRKKVVTQEGGGAQKLGELSDVDVSYAAPKRLHTLAFTGSRWVTFADPVQETGWLVDIKVSAPYVVMGQQHKIGKVINTGTRLCSYIPGTKNVVISELYTLKTSNSRPGVLKMVSEFAPAGIIGVGLPTSTILLELVLGDRPDDLVDVLPGFALKWTQAHANKEVGAYLRVQKPPQVCFTLAGIGFRADYRLPDISKIHVGPAVELKRLRIRPLDLSSDQSSVALGHLNLSDAGLAATGVGVLTMIIAAPVAVGLQAGVIACGLLGAGGRFICRKLEAKARKHDQIRVLAVSKLNSIADRISAALTDDKISEEEFRLILSEVDKYNQMKAEIRRGRQKEGGLAKTEKNRLMNLMRDEMMLTAPTKLLEELQAAGNSGTSR